jgi:hypothetical protein
MHGLCACVLNTSEMNELAQAPSHGLAFPPAAAVRIVCQTLLSVPAALLLLALLLLLLLLALLSWLVLLLLVVILVILLIPHRRPLHVSVVIVPAKIHELLLILAACHSAMRLFPSRSLVPVQCVRSEAGWGGGAACWGGQGLEPHAGEPSRSHAIPRAGAGMAPLLPFSSGAHSGE